MANVYNTEFKEALREIAQRVPRFNSPYDRVRIVEWSRRLSGISDNNIDEAKNRNDYIQLLKIMTRGGRIHGVFLEPPPEGKIPSLSEAMVNVLSAQCLGLPSGGPIEPIVSRQTPDGCAYISFRRIHKKGILCYLAVSPDGLSTSPDERDNGINTNSRDVQRSNANDQEEFDSRVCTNVSHEESRNDKDTSNVSKYYRSLL